MPDYLTPTLNALGGMQQLGQGNANIEDTIARTMATKQLTENRRQLMDQDRATTQALMLTMRGGQSSSDPGTTPSDTDSMVTLAQKNAKSLSAQADMSEKLALSVAQAGGSPDTIYKMQTQAQRDRASALAAQREVRLEQQQQVKRVGDIANTVTDQPSFQTALAQIQKEDPAMLRGLSFDKDLNGNPIYGPRTQRTMDTLAQSSMTVNQQMTRAQKAQELMDREKKQQEDREDKKRRERVDDARVAQLQSQKRATDALAVERETKTAQMQKKLSAAETAAGKDPTKQMREDALSSIKATYEGKFDSTVDAYAGDVAARANKIRYEALKGGESMSLDDARQQAIGELAQYVKPVTAGGFNIFGSQFGGEKRWTYMRGKQEEGAKTTEKPSTIPVDPKANEAPPQKGWVRQYDPEMKRWGWWDPNG